MNQPENILRMTESVCPICLDKIPAQHVLAGGDIYLQKTCAKHGRFSTIIWRGDSKLDYHTWTKEKLPSQPEVCLTAPEKGCPFDCGLCSEHRQQTCCVLLEVTERCNLNCNFCFANSRAESADPSFEKISAWLEYLADLGKPFIHLSGGEPTVRNDLPEIISLAKGMGFPYIQLNTNGLRLGREPEYVKKLKEAGLSSVFMQFDGTRDEIYRQLRGRSLLAEKEKAIQNCGDNHLGVVLVPTVVPGINADNIGEIVNFALARIPSVRGIHFQPVSYFGRYPAAPLDEQRITLPEVISAIENQTKGIFKRENFTPSGCDHARCGFHGSFVLYPDGSVKSLTERSEQACCCSRPTDSSAVAKNRNFVARRWVRDSAENDREQIEENSGLESIDYFLSRVRSHGFTITGMAFQDCWNMDLERLRECSLHVFSPDGRIIPFCAYNLSSAEGESLYRKPGLSQISFMNRTAQIKNKADVLGDKTTVPDQQHESCCGTVKKTEGCLICGKKLIYSKESSKEMCFICRKEYESKMRCVDGHFICDQCHSGDILQMVESFLIASSEVNPLHLIQRVFDLPGLNMHGPEYHSMVPAVLVAAYQNLTGKKDIGKIRESIKRGACIKGGGCGYYGTCGSCVGAGIAVAVIDDVTPMSVDKRALANTVTGLALLEMSKHGGPRCCKREAVTAIKTFMRNTTYFRTVPDVNFTCKQYKINKDCIWEKCPYFPNLSR
ncbi:hypothetical protein DCMF_21150 [Candidatus Formimonas warabiya]|uniref:Radical SAM core domain-containing protein n=1 Tax=Formimonas warabiya TaxID=1761012 RepID=A0A3G1KX37_FORW1|nr:hypothetical protein DCMF_21150 [Candidatus Formimonas warabiya]